MKVILIQGKKDVGKTTLCKAIEKWIIDQWTEEILTIQREPNYSHEPTKDFVGMYEIKIGKEDEKNYKRVIINSASDNLKVIKNFEDFYKKQKPCDILITAIRPKSSNKKLHDKVKDVFDAELKGNKPFVIDLDKSNGSFSLSDVILEIIKN